MSDLNVRTIQRIESGSRASLESLKSLASALETNVATLEQEVMVIDKTSDTWKELPFLFRINFLGSEIGWLGLSRRDLWRRGEKQTAIFGIALMPFAFLDINFIALGMLMISIAYSFALIIRTGDKHSIW